MSARCVGVGQAPRRRASARGTALFGDCPECSSRFEHARGLPVLHGVWSVCWILSRHPSLRCDYVDECSSYELGVLSIKYGM